MSSPFRTPEFKRLLRRWNHRLEESGFKDAEDGSYESMLKDWHGTNWTSTEAQKRAEGASLYYSLASDLLHNGYEFKNALHRRIWELHCAGLSERKIAQHLWSQFIGYRGTTNDNVHLVIVRIQKDAGIKNG